MKISLKKKNSSTKKNSKSKKIKEWVNIFNNQINNYQSLTNTLKNKFFNHLQNLTKIKKQNFFLLENKEMVNIKDFFVKEKKELKLYIDNFNRNEEIYVNDIFKEIRKLHKNVLSSQSMKNICVKDMIKKKINENNFCDLEKNLEKFKKVLNRSCSLNSKKLNLRSNCSINFNDNFSNSILKIKKNNLDTDNKKDKNLLKLKKNKFYCEKQNDKKWLELKENFKNEDNEFINKYQKTVKWEGFENDDKNIDDLETTYKNKKWVKFENNSNFSTNLDTKKLILKKNNFGSINKNKKVKFPKFKNISQIEQKLDSFRKKRKMSEFGDISNKNNYEILSLKADIIRQCKEINMLNEEIKMFKNNLHQKNKDNIFLKEKMERDMIEEKRLNFSFVKNLNRDLKYKEKQIKNLKKDFQVIHKKKNFKFKKNFENMEIMKIGLQNLIEEKIVLKKQLENKENKIKFLKNQIKEFKKKEEKNNKIKIKVEEKIKDFQITNKVLTEKFIQSVEREQLVIFKMTKLKNKLRAYEKYFLDLNVKNHF